MRAWVLVCLLAACERAGDSQNPLGTGGDNERSPARVIVDAGIATLPNDAAKVAIVVDAAVPKPPPPKPPDANKVALQDEVARRMADLLTGPDTGGRNRVSDLDSRRPIGADLARQIDDIKTGGNRVAIGGGRGVRGDGDPRVGTGGSIRVGTGVGPKVEGPGTDPKEKESGPTGRVSVSSKRSTDPDATSLTPDVVLAKIHSVYMAGIKRCYKNALGSDPDLKGRLTITFSVSEVGSVANARAAGMGAAVDDCITAQMGSWRFPVAKDKDGEKTTASFEFGLGLAPE